MKQDHAKQVENGALIAQPSKPNELTIADLDAVTAGTGKQSGGRLAAACCTGRAYSVGKHYNLTVDIARSHEGDHALLGKQAREFANAR